ncbi:hypothetical protein ACFQWB_05155 [Paenibacillus thermoaerophilus]|uniref:Uncharacterized protein n=1 Tax=Paenibacillus thermoaerophilus TaxID=1215385 RepID=A0ABW2V3F9_9BACL|nr:hypothetical protein [Paenibacillus thermoaerophilus]TMV14345.1 hypothetical protein FE781_10495 [Paenibacillus thermoaerophilus]
MKASWRKTWAPLTLALSVALAGSAYAADADSQAEQKQIQPEGKGFAWKHGKGSVLHGWVGLKSEELLTLLGVTKEELKEALQSGKTLAALAEEKGVGTQAVVDLLAKEAVAKLDEKLAAGKLTQEQYDKRKAELIEHITKRVNGELAVKDKWKEAVKRVGKGFGGKNRGASTDNQPAPAQGGESA